MTKEEHKNNKYQAITFIGVFLALFLGIFVWAMDITREQAPYQDPNKITSNINDAPVNKNTQEESPSFRSEAQRALDAYSFTKVEVWDTWSPLACDDIGGIGGSHRFEATTLLGKKVNGWVCCRFFGGCVVVMGDKE